MKRLPLKELEKLVKENPGKELLKALEEDDRKGAKTLAKRLYDKLKRAEDKKKKIEEMFLFERAITYGKENVAGADEAGRGPLAGPIVAAAVILDNNRQWIGLEDSKSLPKNMREEAYDEIKENAICYGVGIVNVRIIDEVNILNANMLALEKALEKLKLQSDMVLFDGDRVPPGYIDRGEAIIKGDKKAASIAAAGIMAKVTRDRIMDDLDKNFPGYGFSSNRGYPTKKHYLAIERFGPTPIHRKSFLKERGF